MAHQIVEIRVCGVRRKMLLREDMPVYYPNLYLSLEHSGRALSTQQKYLEHIGRFEDFLEYESIDLKHRLEERPNSLYLTDGEISRLVLDATFNKCTLDKKYTGARLLPSDYKTVGGAHVQQRLDAVRNYLKFLYDKLGDETTRDAAVDDVERRINRKIKAIKPAWKKNKNDDRKGLTNQERGRLLEVMNPESSENPFANEAVKRRNYIILLLGLELGLRRSEMLLLKVGDIHWYNSQLSIGNLKYRDIDPRGVAPQFNSYERRLQMSDDLTWALSRYEGSFRAFAKGRSEANKHPFLLVSHRRNEGSPMSIKALDGILPRVGKVVPELAHVHLHTLRHDAIYGLIESMREDLATLSPEVFKIPPHEILTYFSGWSPESNMPSLYGAKFW